MSKQDSVSLNPSLSRRQFIGVAGTAALATLLPSAAVKVLAQQQTGEKIPLTTDWRIIVAQNATKPEIFAAEELQHYIQKLIGYSLKIEASNELEQQKAFIIGRHPALQPYAEKLDSLHGVRPDSFALIANADFIGMVGASKIATCFAAWQWLEELGVRWLFPTPRGEYVPQLKEIATTAGESYFTPDINQRWIWPWAGSRQKKEGAFTELEHDIPAWNLHQLRLRVWDNYNYISPEDKVGNIGWGHSYFRFLPAEKYFKDHPEWYNLVGGRRRSSQKEGMQVCFTNEEGAKEFAKNVIADIKKNPGDPRRMIVKVMPNDVRAWCECENCQKLVDKDGSATSMVVNYTNLVAREVGKVYPGLLIYTLAYWNHSTPPDHVKADPNVAVQITQWPSADSFFFNNAKPGLMEQGNAKFAKAYQRWSEMCSNVTVYQYYGHYVWWTPWPMKTQMDYDLKRHVQNPSFRGYCCEYRTQWGNQGIGMYFLAKLGWDAKQDADALQKDYCRAAFGPAAELMSAYYNTLQASMDAAPRVGGNYWHLSLVLTSRVIDRCNQLIQEARALMPQMDEGTRWRTDLVTECWRLSALFGEAVTLFYQPPSLANLQKIRANFQSVLDYAANGEYGLFLMEGPVASREYTQPFLVPLEALPAGTHKYVDKMNYGGSSKFHAKSSGLKSTEWGYRIAAGGKAWFEITVKAMPGHRIKSFKPTIRSVSGSKFTNYNIIVSSSKGSHVFTEKPLTGTALAMPDNLLDSPEITLRIEMENTASTEQTCLYELIFDVEVV